MTIEIYGASDDLIEIEGDIREEFSALGCDEDRAWLALSDGTLLGVRYDEDGVWRFVKLLGGASVTIVQAPPNDEDNYSDRVTVESVIDWIVMGTQCAARKVNPSSNHATKEDR